MKVQFIDFWSGDWDPNDNIFVQFLRKYTNVEVVNDGRCDILIYSFFGNNHKHPIFKNVKKVFYLGEPYPARPEADLNLTFNFTPQHNNIRLPLWMLHHIGVDWFNPNAFNYIDKFYKKDENILLQKNKFCAFISRVHQQHRVDFVKKLSEYKHVECPGPILNNTGSVLGGTWEDKVNYLKPFKFCIAFENRKQDGYCSEKILQPFLAGCIPLYWGANRVEEDFRKESFLCLEDLNDVDKFIKTIKLVDNNDELWMKLYNEICFTKSKEEMISHLEYVMKKIYELSFII